MANLLVPIAVSSQLDVTGEERIHAAPYIPTTRAVYTPPDPTFDIVVMQGGGGFALANFNTVTNAVTVEAVNSGPDYFQSRPWMMGSDVCVHYQWAASGPAVVAVRADGVGGFTTIATLSHGSRECVGAAKLSETRFVAFYRDSGVTNFTAKLVGYDGAAFTELDELDLDETLGRPGYCTSVNHNGDIVFVPSSSSKPYCVVSSTADVLSVVYSTLLSSYSAADVCSTGDYIVLNKGTFLEWDGADMTVVQATTGTLDGCAYDGERVYFVDYSAGVLASYRLADSPFTSAADVTHYDSYPGASNGYVFIPEDNGLFGPYSSGILKWNGSSYDHLADFQFAQWPSVGDMANLVATVVRTNNV